MREFLACGKINYFTNHQLITLAINIIALTIDHDYRFSYYQPIETKHRCGKRTTYRAGHEVRLLFKNKVPVNTQAEVSSSGSGECAGRCAKGSGFNTVGIVAEEI